MSECLALTVELSRADSPDDPYAFSWGTRRYQRNRPGEVPRVGELIWDHDLAETLASLASATPDPASRDTLGAALRGLLMELGWERDEAAILEACAAGSAVELVLRFSAAELYALPWELVPTGDRGQRLSQVSGVHIRYAWPAEATSVPSPVSATHRPRRLLFAWSAAGGRVPAATHLESLRAACASGNIELHDANVVANASYPLLAATLARATEEGHPYTALHLLCHGGQVQSDETVYGLVLDDEDTGRDVVDGARLGEMIAAEAPDLALVVLAACRSSDPGAQGSRLGSVAQRLHRHGVQSVVASRWPLTVPGSLVLARELYGGLLGMDQGNHIGAPPLSLDEALARVGRAMQASPHPSDATSIQLYSRCTGEIRPFSFRPYRGLLAFGPEHARFFYGRDAELTELLTEMAQLRESGAPRFQVVEGASGSGKSSLVWAGAVPALQRAEDAAWTWTRLVPGDHPLEALEAALEQVPPLGEGQRHLLFVDQLEEVFTLVDDTEAGKAERDRFLSKLWALASSPDGAVHVIATLRSDFRGECGTVDLADGLRMDALFRSDMAHHNVFVARMPAAQLREAIVRPAQAVGLQVPDELTGRILNDIGNEPGALALMEYLLDLVWQRREGAALTSAAYQALGGVAQALSERADALVASMPPDEAVLVRKVFLPLVDLGRDGAPDSRRRVPLADLRSGHAERVEVLDRVITRLIEERLLVRSEGRSGATLEVAHEALIRSWPMLGRWLDEDRKHRVELDLLQSWVNEWDQFGDAGLLTGQRLARAEAIAERYHDLSARMRMLVEQSQQAQAAAGTHAKAPPTASARSEALTEGELPPTGTLSPFLVALVNPARRGDYLVLAILGLLPLPIAAALGVDTAYTDPSGQTFSGYYGTANWMPISIYMVAALWLLRALTQRIAPVVTESPPPTLPAILELMGPGMTAQAHYASLRASLLSRSSLILAVVVTSIATLLDVGPLAKLYWDFDGPDDLTVTVAELDWTVMFLAEGSGVGELPNALFCVLAYSNQVIALFFGIVMALFMAQHNRAFLARIYQRRWGSKGGSAGIVLQLDDPDRCFGLRPASRAFNAQVSTVAVATVLCVGTRYTNVFLGPSSEITPQTPFLTVIGDSGQLVIVLLLLVALAIVSMPAVVKFLPLFRSSHRTHASIVGYLQEFTPTDIAPEDLEQVADRFARSAFWPSGNNRAKVLFILALWSVLVLLVPDMALLVSWATEVYGGGDLLAQAPDTRTVRGLVMVGGLFVWLLLAMLLSRLGAAVLDGALAFVDPRLVRPSKEPRP